jgi:Arc/MetJ-type ribon-helix-helix transcriptional regulator
MPALTGAPWAVAATCRFAAAISAPPKHARRDVHFELASRRFMAAPLVIFHPFAIYLPSNRMEWRVDMADVHELRSKIPDSEKITVNLGFIDLGRMDLMVRDGFYANRADFIRTAVRNQLERQDDAVRQSVARRQLKLGMSHYTLQDLEAARDAGTPLHIQVLGLASIASDVTPELARAAIASVQVLGAFQASPAVKAALVDRTV